MNYKESIFRAYDIRGKFPVDFDISTILGIGKALGRFFGEGKTIVLGGDVRLSTPVIKSAISTGLMDEGCNVLDIGICTTPTIYFVAAKNNEIDGGIMITASHNPIEYNGIKVCDGKGVSYHIDNLFTKIKNDLREYIEAKRPDLGYGRYVEFPAIGNNQYYNFQKENFHPKKRMKIAIDIGNGTCFRVKKLLESKKLEVTSLHSEPDGRFPVMIPDPVKPSCLQYLQKLMKEESFDIGIGFDADGDRVGFVDDKTNIVKPDQIIMIFGKKLLEKRPNSEILVDVKTSSATFEYLSELGAKIKFTKVGHSWIHETLLKTGAIFAGELSGHYYFNLDYYGFDDAIYSALKMIEILSETEDKFSELVAKLPKYFSTNEVRIKCPERHKSKIVANIKEYLEKQAVKSITIDGIRAEFEDGWVLVRESGTEPIISVRAEAKSSTRLSYYEKFVIDLVNSQIEALAKKSKDN
ncbi:MAG: phosphomannomutase/phosphoglucomutase [Candidatus Hodarchaeales archaeon]